MTDYDFTELLPDSYIQETNEQVEAWADPIDAPAKAIVGTFRRGDVHTAVEVNSWGEFVARFGGFWGANSSAPDHVHAFYTNAQNDMKGKLYVIRILNLSTIADPTSYDAVISSATIYDSTGTKASHEGTQAETFTFVLSTDDLLNIKINGGSTIPITFTAGVGVTAQTVINEINLALTGEEVEAYAVTGGKVGLRHTQYGAAKDFEIEASSTCLTVLGLTAATYAGTNGNSRLTVKAKDPGLWGNNLQVVIAYNNDGTMNFSISGDQRTEDFVDLELIEYPDDPTRKANYFLNKINHADRTIGSLEVTVTLTGTIVLGTILDDRPREGTYSLASGTQGTSVTTDDFIGDSTGGTGIYGLSGVDVPVDWICPEKETVMTFVGTALTYSKNALNKFFIWCYAKSEGYASAITIRDSEAWNNSYGGNYFLYIQYYYNSKDISGAGMILGLYAYNDRLNGVYRSPSGLDMKLIGANILYTKLTDVQAGKLNGKNINYAFTFAGKGTVLWGGRTVYQGKKWRYIVSRRDMIVIEHNLRIDGRSAIHRNNDENLWSLLYQNGKALLQDWFAEGGLTGNSEAEAFFIKCDKDTNPQSVIDNGIVRRYVRVKLPKIAEFVITVIDQQV